MVGGLAWWLAARPVLAVDTDPLAQLPSQLGRWTAQNIALEPAVEEELRADFNVQRVYSTPGEVPIVLYVGDYGTQRGGRPEQTARSRLRSFGTQIDRALADHWPVESDQTEPVVSLSNARSTVRPPTESTP